MDISNGYVVVMQHPVTTEYEQAREHVNETLHAVHELGLPTLWFWPNVDAGSDGTSTGMRAFREQVKPKQMHFFKNMEGTDFLRLLCNSKCLIGNSSVGVRECSYLGVPVVNIGSRQTGRDRGRNVIDVDYDREAIIGGVEKHLSNGTYPSDPIYGDGHAGQRIAELLATQPLHIEKRLAY
jgi:UDP-hydrolysing UDP-N-acetyl-D-glucosamine 2-epimerase